LRRIAKCIAGLLVILIVVAIAAMIVWWFSRMISLESRNPKAVAAVVGASVLFAFIFFSEWSDWLWLEIKLIWSFFFGKDEC